MTLRSLPSVDRLLQTDAAKRFISAYGRSLTVQVIREALDAARITVKEGGSVPTSDMLLQEIQHMLQHRLNPTLRTVINASGVIIHTNLGRSPLSRTAREAMMEVARGYSTLEYDLARGKRGKREQHCEAWLREISGAEAALVVNNNASAVLLALTALAKRKPVLISRSQLIEIGGGFRIPDVMRQSGAKLVEVGTTNRTHLEDFETAIEDRTGLILLAHHSNFKIVGFTTEPSLAQLVGLGKKHGVPILHDLGSGALIDTAQFGLGHEPTVQESIAAEADIVAFSGDKLLGGPQAGILVGRKIYIDKLRRHALARAVRPDKLCLAALAATLQHYLKDEALEQIPVWRMISMPLGQIQERVESWVSQLGSGAILESQSTVGGGSLPEETLPTWTLALNVKKPNAFSKRLREAAHPIIARIEGDLLILDPRTVLPEQDQALLNTLREQLKKE